MCRAPSQHRWPVLLPALLVLGLARTSSAQPLARVSVDAGDATKERPSPELLAPKPFGHPIEDSAAPTIEQDAGAAIESLDSLPRTETEGIADDGGARSGSAQAATNAVEDKPAFLNMTVNKIDIGDVLVVLRGDDVLVKVSDLESSGLHAPEGKREKQGDDLLVSLRSLSPQIAFASDERSLSLAIVADPALFGGTVVDLRAKRPAGIIYDSAPSMFVNYSISLDKFQGRSQLGWNGFSEAGVSVRGHLLYASGQRSVVDGSWDRLLTNLTFDLRDRLTSIVLGDTSATGDALGGGLSMGGISVARNFGLDPYFVFLPTQRISGTALTPSTVEVYVNGQLVRRETLPPGQFTLQNLSVTSGRGDTRVVIRDAFGAQQTMLSPYYLALGTLAKGLQDFSYNAGFARENFGTESWSYGQPAFLFRHRYGLTEWLTVGGRVEGSRHLMSGGPTLAFRLPVGEVGLGVAASDHSGYTGEAALLSYSFVGRALNFQMGLRLQSVDYATLYLAPASLPPANALPADFPSASDRQRVDFLISIARNVGSLASLSLQYEAIEWREQGWNNQITLSANRSLTRWMYAFATFTNIYRRDWPAEYGTFLGLSFSPAERITAGASRSDRWGGDARGHGGTSQATLQQSLPLGPGLGYRLVASQGDNAINEATAQYQGAYGRIEADYQHEGWETDNRGTATLTATGGLVLIGSRAYLTRPIQDSYALIRVPGVAGVHGLVSNQVVGTTDSKGDLLIPSMLHYYGNRVGIDDKDIPLDHDIEATERVIAPPTRGGAIVTFPVRRVQSVAGAVVIDDQGKSVLPAYGQLVVSVDKRETISPLDEAGNFYLENVPPGSYAAEVQYEAGTCAFSLAVPVGSTALVNVGTIRCILPQKESK
jgi:outer membrane usher protein